MEIKTDAKNNVRWRILVGALCFAAEWWDILYINLLFSSSTQRKQTHVVFHSTKQYWNQ